MFVPAGAATALALEALFELGISHKDLAVLCQLAENDFVGVASGIMDQYASLLCEAGSALLVDCRSLEAESVPVNLEEANLALLVCDTRVERGLADTGYNDRRAICERAAAPLGVEHLRDAGLETIDVLKCDIEGAEQEVRPVRRQAEQPAGQAGIDRLKAVEIEPVRDHRDTRVRDTPREQPTPGRLGDRDGVVAEPLGGEIQTPDGPGRRSSLDLGVAD